ncbi:hypothetical protein [Halopseudomonas salina]|uniref:Uncharacterized protein n=1 Tax=Halopseudomonas salina TaxID=1323744 RepID=A0ABQ1Q112_9GAMM|nr:hypothetical protein [Halopseudomonas salina]GGD09469.1 hypothetical protein GCM10007418_30650 [Halopseudomonas salina]
MNLRVLVYPFSFIAFAPAVLLFNAGVVLIVPATILDLTKGNFEMLQYFALLIGGGAGLTSAALLTFDIAGRPIIDSYFWLKRLGLMIGFFAELVVIALIEPQREALLYYWLPQIVGAVVLFGLSFGITANQALQRTSR